jgi:hypothetical protein
MPAYICARILASLMASWHRDIPIVHRVIKVHEKEDGKVRLEVMRIYTYALSCWTRFSACSHPPPPSDHH